MASSQLSERELVREISRERGHLGEDKLSKIGEIDPELRRTVEEALLRKDEMIGSGVLTLARNLYTSNARFIFELLQNADDNDYSKIIAKGQEPFVSFDIRSDKLSIECNENGFTRENLRAICDIGKSSKIGAQGYIGEKGIGFKSVFMAAWKVHIQSNGFSFSFTHRKGDSGLGMVTPIWEETDETLGDCLTRITLFLHESGDAGTNARQLETIKLQFRDLQDTILLFLRKLRKVQVSFHSEDGTVTDTTMYSLHGSDPTTIRKTTLAGETFKRYHVTRHIAHNVPKSENRTYSDEGWRTDAAPEIVLAFPLTDAYEPIVQDQDVFAFLPMRPMGFKFLIHTDFVTEASRQGFVTTSLRNQVLLDGIADCFIKAVEQFCQHPTLQFQWMRWLPQANSYPWDDYWRGLLERIRERIKPMKVFRTWEKEALESLQWLRYLLPTHLDQHGEPLFRDAKREYYLSKKYTFADVLQLYQYGLENLDSKQFLHLLLLDLRCVGGPSRLRNDATDEDWHSRAARVLLTAHAALPKSSKDGWKTVKLIPLTNGNWVTPGSDHLNFYSTCTGGVAIPDGLGYTLVSAAAANNPDRRKLLDELGCRSISTQEVRSTVINRCDHMARNHEALSASIGFLRYLYLSESLVGEFERNLPKRLGLFDQRMQFMSPYYRAIYLPSADKYGPLELLKGTSKSGEGFETTFLHERYLEAEPQTPEGLDLSWADWLESRMSVRRNLPLTQVGTDGELDISAEFRYIETHRPEKLLGALQQYWPLEEAIITSSPETMSLFRELEVSCKGNNDYGFGECLHATYLPLPELESKHARYAEGDEYMFVDLGEPITMGYRPKWAFLVDHLGVGHQDDLEFYITILQDIWGFNTTAANVVRSSRILDLYETIHSRCRESESFENASAKVRDAFVNGCLVFAPGTKSRSAAWASLDKCLWHADENMQTAYPLEHLYRTQFGRSQADLDILKQFFEVTLQIQDCTWKTYLNEIRFLKTGGSEDFDWVYKLYSSLATACGELSATDAESLRGSFSTEPLIYASFGQISGWYTISQCLWSSSTQIKGRVALNDLYPDLGEFFLDFLGVQELTIQMAFDELKYMGSQEPGPSVFKVKETIWAFNSLLDSEGGFPGSHEMVHRKILPVRYPNGFVKLQAMLEDFAIANRKALKEIFETRVKLLDFTLDEVRRLAPFFEWLGAESRYLSNMVREISTVADDQMHRLQYPDRDIGRKAHSLFRIAVHFNSPRISDNSLDLYKVLRRTEVFETNGISSELHLSQDGHDIVYSQEKSELHLRENAGELKVYVPHHPSAQGFCYFSTLPRRLLEWMMTDPSTLITKSAGSRAAHVVTSVLNAPMVNVEQILEAEGIVDKEVPDDSEIGIKDGNNEDLRARDLPARDRGSQISSKATPSLETNASSGLTSQRTPNQPLFILGPSPDAQSSASSLFPEATNGEPVGGNDPEYLRLIEEVISASRRVRFPAKDTADISGLFSGLSIAPEDVESSRRFISRSNQERDLKIGALGELLVFELLSGLSPSLPGFGRENWQSQIRKFVTVHEKYSDMLPWNGRETSDIVYHDKDRVLTELLVEKGHLQRETWLKKTPRYFIEVKCTVGKASTPFYISKAQYRRMQDYVNASTSPLGSPTVYLIARVFNMNKGNVDLQIYVNPERMRQDEGLVFTTETWSVVPGRGR